MIDVEPRRVRSTSTRALAVCNRELGGRDLRPRASRGEHVVRKFVAAIEGVNSDQKALLKTLADRGNDLGMPESKGLGQGLFELRGSEVRIFYCFRPGRRIVLMDGMLKKRQDIPDEVLDGLRKLARRIE